MGLVSPTSIRSRILKADPRQPGHHPGHDVSPTSIRSRILKAYRRAHLRRGDRMVSPTSIRSRILKVRRQRRPRPPSRVSPTSIRSRILKDGRWRWTGIACSGFTHVDPFEDTESSVNLRAASALRCFTHVDPFEDTERWAADALGPAGADVSPTSIRSRILKGCKTKTNIKVCSVSPTSIRSRILKGKGAKSCRL